VVVSEFLNHWPQYNTIIPGAEGEAHSKP